MEKVQRKKEDEDQRKRELEAKRQQELQDKIKYVERRVSSKVISSNYLPGFHTECFGGNGENDVQRATPAGVGCFPRKVLKFTCSEVASGGFWGSTMAGN